MLRDYLIASINFSSEKFIDAILIFVHTLWLLPMNHAGFIPRIKCFFILLLLMIVDISPIPVLEIICMFILLFRPRWFKELIDRIYAVESTTDNQ